MSLKEYVKTIYIIKLPYQALITIVLIIVVVAVMKCLIEQK